MADSVYTRFVDEKCAQAQWLIDRQVSADSQVGEASLLQALCAAAELALVGYFAEQSQKRFKADVWQTLVKTGPSFHALAEQTKAPQQVLTYWRQMELDEDSSFALVLRAITQSKMPTTGSYRSSLLTETSLQEGGFSSVIASSAAMPAVTLPQFVQAWSVVEAQIQFDRDVSVEC